MHGPELLSSPLSISDIGASYVLGVFALISVIYLQKSQFHSQDFRKLEEYVVCFEKGIGLVKKNLLTSTL